MTMVNVERIQKASAKHPAPAGMVYQYGTAGFRLKADLLDSVVFRVGLMAGLRSKKLSGQVIGIMITASHNPPSDNGIKMVDPLGEMLESSWEAPATGFANVPNEGVGEAFAKLIPTLKIKADNEAHVVFARDTRPSGIPLIQALKDAFAASGVKYTDYGVLTTPQLHYVTRCLNTQHKKTAYGVPTEEGYYKKLGDAFVVAMKYKKTKGHVTVDCANGVGGKAMRDLLKYLPSAAQGGIDIKIVNDKTDDPEMLNVQCGADYVKTQQRPPPSLRVSNGDRCCSLDGDADRIVYYFKHEEKFILLDGDRIATLAASFLGDLVRQALLADTIKVGVVQTAYANGGSTEYITKILRQEIICTNTGVKHLHHAAARFDIGVYFEANGHGTVLFSSQAHSAIKNTEPTSPAQQLALNTLKAMENLINQAVGDALSDMLLVEVILAQKNWTCVEWANTYTDLPNRLVRVEVQDRNIFRAVDAERKLESPDGCQEDIDAVVGKYTRGRSFARASGTEDAVRVYAEAHSRSEADDLANKITEIVRRYGGRGWR